jgi:hypothetical protein
MQQQHLVAPLVRNAVKTSCSALTGPAGSQRGKTQQQRTCRACWRKAKEWNAKIERKSSPRLRTAVTRFPRPHRSPPKILSTFHAPTSTARCAAALSFFHCLVG